MAFEMRTPLQRFQRETTSTDFVLLREYLRRKYEAVEKPKPEQPERDPYRRPKPKPKAAIQRTDKMSPESRMAMSKAFWMHAVGLKKDKKNGNGTGTSDGAAGG